MIGSLTGPTIAVRLHKSGGVPGWGADFSAHFNRLDAVKGRFKDEADRRERRLRSNPIADRSRMGVYWS